MTKRLGLFAAFLLIGNSVLAAPSSQQGHELSTSVVEIPVPQAHRDYFNSMAFDVDQARVLRMPSPVDIGSWIAIGKQVWEIIESMAGKMRLDPMLGVGVIPSAARSMGDMNGWQVAQPRSYEVKIRGSVGTAFRYRYTVGFNYGGKFRQQGKFLANVAILPFEAKCGWTWNCLATVTVGNPVNVGGAREETPALPIDMVVTAQGRVNAKAAGVHFTVYGDGRLEQTVSH